VCGAYQSIGTTRRRRVAINSTMRMLGLGTPVRTVITGPIYHSAPNGYATFTCQLGGFVALQARFDPEELLALVERHRITHLHMVPIMFVRLLRLPERVKAAYDLSSLRFVLHAAAPCPPEVKRAMIDWWGPIIHEYYGSTETSAVTSCDTAEWIAHPGTVGRAIEGAVVRTYRDDGTECATGEVGEVFARLFGWPDFTYHRHSQSRADHEREGLFSAGDIGFLDDDGYLHLRDRKVDMVICGGVNIYPTEIEACLLDMAGTADCAVFGMPDDEYGEALVAVIELDGTRPLSADDVRAHVRRHLAGFKVPKVIEFTTALPRQDSGKVFKRKLRQPYWENVDRRI
jgi:long-chain acyl-CoA synthetase